MGSEGPGKGQQGGLLWGVEITRGVQPDLNLGSLVPETGGTNQVLSCIMRLL